jgi:hypothetical protein
MAASREELENLIRAADAAGDGESVNVLFGELDKLGPVAAPEQRMETREEVDARVKAKYSGMSFWDKVKGDLGFVKDNAAAPIARGVVKGVTSIPTLAADVGVATRNLFPGQDYELPSQTFERDVYNRALPMGDAPGNRALEFGASIIGGAKVPAPQVKAPAPAGFVKPNPDAVRQLTLANSQKAGYVVPPSTTNPNLGNSFLESFGGKIATAQDAALKNQDVTNKLAKSALGLSDDAPLTQEALGAVRKEAGKAFETLRSAGAVALDDATTKSLDEIAAKFSGSKLKEALGGSNDVAKIVQAIKSEPLTGDTAVDAIALLRDKASTAFTQGSKEVGKAYKAMASHIEGLMEKSLSGEALKNFREARQTIAKTYSVEGAFNASTGNVLATKLAGQLQRGKPLSGDLLTAAQFGQAFPKAAREIVDSGAVRNTDAILGSGAAVFSGHPWYLGWPFLRQAARNLLLSPAGQRMAVPSTGPLQVPQEPVMGLLGGVEALRR